ncbi:hypothetical protein G6L37_05940 [Agrobacterium rubi]|nr:hypothetical protein [Agrobacterium rubi]NTF24901.1 hypothetical protein [Agrobacterium rubi]
MADIETLTDGIEAVARFSEKRLGRASHFHLMACGGCGCPAFRQPCSLCGYYPMGADRGSWHPEVATKEMFCSMVERTGPGGRDGTIATWHALSNLRKYESREILVEDASIVEVPTAEEYWNAICVDGLRLERPEPAHRLADVWWAVSDMAAIANGEMYQPQSSVAPSVNALVRDWVEAVHSEDASELEAVLGRLRDMTSGLLFEYPRNGNLTSARSKFDEAIQRLQDERPMQMGA